ncbi:MAG: glycosyltransferase family 4 protein [Phycisphaerae bacterium]
MAKESGISPISVAYIQDGARMHYAQPLALHRQAMLCALYTDWYNDQSFVAKTAIAVARRISPASAARMEQRCHPDLAGVPVFHHPLLGLLGPLAWKRSPTETAIGRWALARMAGSELKRGPLVGNPGYPTLVMGPVLCFSPESVKIFQSRGIRVVVDQVIAPLREVIRQRELQQARWARWESNDDGRDSGKMAAAEELLLREVDHIVAPSEYVGDSLRSVGLEANRVSLLEYPMDANCYTTANRSGRNGPMVLGFVGAVGLRKGIPWLVEALKHIDPAIFRCVVVGPVGLTDYGLAELKRVAEVIGPVPRGEVARWMEKFDVFFFPSTCEGSPTVVAEAMATGLPVVTSLAGGQLIREGIDGFVRPYDQPDEYAKCITLLAKDREMRLAMGTAARQRVEEFSIDAYGRGLREIIRGVTGAVP